MLPLQVHVLDFTGSSMLDAVPLSDGQLQDMLKEVNRVWGQGKIRWDLQAVFRESIEPTEGLLEMVSGRSSLSTRSMVEALPKANRVSGGWDVFLFGDLGAVGAAGVYMGNGWIVSTVAPDGTLVDPDGFAGRVFAHELGHSLGLGHVACSEEGNLMAPACFAGDRTLLTDAQVRLARNRAILGEPF